MDCIFCKIINGIHPVKIVSETGDSIAFLDIHPVCPGHTLVIPKIHTQDLSSSPDEMLSELIVHARKTAMTLVKALGATGYNLVNANGLSAQQTIFHLHFHIIPRFDQDGLTLGFHGQDKDMDLDQIHSRIMKGSAPGVHPSSGQGV